jgi:hypothetical protein
MTDPEARLVDFQSSTRRRFFSRGVCMIDRSRLATEMTDQEASSRRLPSSHPCRCCRIFLLLVCVIDRSIGYLARAGSPGLLGTETASITPWCTDEVRPQPAIKRVTT